MSKFDKVMPRAYEAIIYPLLVEDNKDTIFIVSIYSRHRVEVVAHESKNAVKAVASLWQAIHFHKSAWAVCNMSDSVGVLVVEQ